MLRNAAELSQRPIRERTRNSGRARPLRALADPRRPRARPDNGLARAQSLAVVQVLPIMPRRVVHVQTATKIYRHPAAGTKDLDLPIMMQRVIVELPSDATNRLRQRSERVGFGSRRAKRRIRAIAGLESFFLQHFPPWLQIRNAVESSTLG